MTGANKADRAKILPCRALSGVGDIHDDTNQCAVRGGGAGRGQSTRSCVLK